MVDGLELLLGVRDDPQYGPLMAVGVGGVMVEVMQDIAVRLLPITDEIARKYAQSGAIGLLWGNSAQELRTFFPDNRLVRGVHPSPLSAHRGFIGSKPFTRVNQLLHAIGSDMINW